MYTVAHTQSIGTCTAAQALRTTNNERASSAQQGEQSSTRMPKDDVSPLNTNDEDHSGTTTTSTSSSLTTTQRLMNRWAEVKKTSKAVRCAQLLWHRAYRPAPWLLCEPYTDPEIACMRSGCFSIRMDCCED